MSYCRYGTDNGKSDVYIYGCYDKDYNIHYEICLSWKKAAEMEIVQSIVCKTRKELLIEMNRCKEELGLHVPRSAFRRVKKEIKEEKLP